MPGPSNGGNRGPNVAKSRLKRTLLAQQAHPGPKRIRGWKGRLRGRGQAWAALRASCLPLKEKCPLTISKANRGSDLSR